MSPHPPRLTVRREVEPQPRKDLLEKINPKLLLERPVGKIRPKQPEREKSKAELAFEKRQNLFFAVVKQQLSPPS